GAASRRGATCRRLFWVGEDHATRDGLEHAGDGDLNGLAYVGFATLDDDHRAVVEVADALAQFFALLHDLDRHLLARQEDGLDGVGQLVDVEHLDTLQLGDAVEVEIVGDDGGMPLAGELDQLGVHLGDVLGVGVGDLDLDHWLLLQALEDVQAAATAGAAHAVGGIGDVLELLQHEAGHHERARNETGLGDVSDATVNDGAGIDEDPVVAAGVPPGAE